MIIIFKPCDFHVHLREGDLAKQVFAENNVDYEYIDISNDEEATQKAIQLNNGIRRIPVIIFEDQSILVEPNREEILSKLG